MIQPDCHACDEYNALSRRQFFHLTGGTALALAAPAWLPRIALAQEYCSSRDVIVSIFLRGAADGLTLCCPHADKEYYVNRPTLAIPEPGSGPNAAIDLDGYFGFPPHMAALLPAYQAGHLLVVHACGSTDPTRSHFDAQRFMEIGRPADNSLVTGWLGRHLMSAPPLVPNPLLRAVGIGFGLQQTLQGSPQALPIPDLDRFGLRGNPTTVGERRAALADMYDLVPDPLRAAAQSTQATIDLLDQINFAGYTPAGGAVYPDSPLGYALKSSAALVKADVGVEAVAIDVGGWDTHNLQGSIQGVLASLMTNLANCLAAFHADMFAGNGRNLTVLVMSEFGRRLAENGSLGTDHGHGNALFLIGNNIAGGRVLTQWPGLAPGQLFEGRDLEVTIDFRDILAEVVYRRLGNPNLDLIFPGYAPTFRGVTLPCVRGDMNCDGVLTPDDAAPFAQALTDPAAYGQAHPACNPSGADVNSDGRIDGADVRAFTQALLNP